MEYKMVIVVRDDLSLSCGKIAAQASHAAVGCAFLAKKNRTKWFRSWRDEGEKKVVVRAADLDELYNLQRDAKARKITTYLVTDAGLTEIPPGTTTCLGIGPAPNKQLDPITGALTLLK
jgi:PTH2 family peptidyl-tRNA hydrolase